MVELTVGDREQPQGRRALLVTRGVGFVAVGALFAAGWIVELWLIVIAVSALAGVMTKAWFVRTNRDLPVAAALDAVASASRDGSWTDERYLAAHLALMAGRDAEVLEDARERLPDLVEGPAQQERARRRLAHARAELDAKAIPGLEPTRHVRPRASLVVTSTVIVAILWLASGSRWWLAPLGIAFVALAFSLQALAVRHQRPILLAEIAATIESRRPRISPREIAHHAEHRPRVLGRARRLVTHADLSAEVELGAVELINEAIFSVTAQRRR